MISRYDLKINKMYYVFDSPHNKISIIERLIVFRKRLRPCIAVVCEKI